jgi:CheY-like chemotaxis protein
MSLCDIKILLIEDNEMNRQLCCDILEIYQAQVHEVESAEEGLEYLESEIPDLILMDVQLPGMDGMQATRIIKQRPEWNQIPVVAVTAHAMTGEMEKIRQAGFDGQISKPFTITNFVAEIFRLLGIEIE